MRVSKKHICRSSWLEEGRWGPEFGQHDGNYRSDMLTFKSVCISSQRPRTTAPYSRDSSVSALFTQIPLKKWEKCIPVVQAIQLDSCRTTTSRFGPDSKDVRWRSSFRALRKCHLCEHISSQCRARLRELVVSCKGACLSHEEWAAAQSRRSSVIVGVKVSSI